MLKQPWFLFTLITVLAWGLWGALIDVPAAAGFPATLGYIVWAITMIPPCMVALARVGWQVETDRRSVLYGCLAGFLGAGGQLVLFLVLRIAPAYLVFPFIALSPLVTILLALAVSRERASARGWAGIALALVAGILLAYTPPGSGAVHGLLWVGPALVVFLAWGLQGFVISHGNKSMRAESIFFYMTLTGLLLIPAAWFMTDFSRPITWGFRGPWMAALIQVLNAVGALLLVYAFRYGRAIIVSPLVNAGGPVVTIILSLILFRTLPLAPHALGMVAAVLATLLMGMEDETPAQA
ncbi:DMT family transporter [Mesoterricola silvestris]|uniref:Membrane protein n=1 Tax=Mesoterricola silvestris TaxID=2927979 RepID=A0AA48GWF1_9BACT|nr:DMT family transporter [Mesoterricola silvestris]BDU71578.1 membrane protein [Mesoterricola silvestris]